MKILIGIAVVIWLYSLSVFTRAKLYFFKFVIGAIGLFSFLMVFLEPYLVIVLSRLVTVAAGMLGQISGYYTTFHEYALILIAREDATISLYIDYECSGVIEILAFISMLWFFPIYNTLEKLVGSLIGAVWIFIANIIRLFVICTLVYYYGNGIFYFAHTIFGRVIFYVLSILLYFHTFTRAHIKRQKIGRVSYGDHIK